MADAITMPKMGFEMLEGTVVAWLKREGDSVGKGEVIAEIETDKAIVELESPCEGTLIGIAVVEGQTAAIGTPLAYVGTPGEQPPPTIAATTSRRVSPVAQRIGADFGIDVATVAGTGAGGLVTKQDVLQAVLDEGLDNVGGMRTGHPPRLPDAAGRIVLGPMGEAIARRTEATIREVPHYYSSMRIDMTDALEYRREINNALDRGPKVSVNDLMIRACTLTLLKHPVFNSTYEGGHLQVQPHVSIGIAVALQHGLIVPAIHACEAKSLPEIARAAKDVVERAKDGKLRQAEYSGTFTISNLGMYSIDHFTAIIVRPQVAVLSLGSIKPTPIVIGKDVVVRQTMTATLGSDHRAIQGAESAQFLVELRRLLEEPRLLGD